jgi:Fe-S oxidoreductase/nitrate reductase gamma subunit
VLAGVPTREVFQGIGLAGKAVFYVLSLAVIGAFLAGVGLRVRKYARGRPAGRLAPLLGRGGPRGVRPAAAAAEVGGRAVARGDLPAGLAHAAVFWGFTTLFVGTVILTIDYDVVRNATRLLWGEERSFFRGAFYVAYSVVLDTMGLAAVVGLAFLAVRRALGTSPKLDYARAEVPEGGYSRRAYVLGDWVFLGLLGLTLLTGFVEEGFRIRAARLPEFEVWSPVGWLLARGLEARIGPSAAEAARLVTWWVHSVLALALVAIIPYSKAMHMIVDAASLAFHDPSSSQRLPPPPRETARPGYRRLEDFTWKELLDLDACTKCGRCHVVCPARGSGAPLSPRDLILDLRQWVAAAAGPPTLLDAEERPEPSGPLVAGDGEVSVAGDVIPEATLWACTTCMACVAACPVGIEHVPTIVQLRRSLVDQGRVEPGVQEALRNLAQQGNSFGKSARARARWTRGLPFQIPDARKEAVRYLWFVGDFASFDERLQEISATLARVLHGAGVSFGLLYEAERNSGNDVRRVGEEGLFEMLVEQNLAAFREARFEEIFTTDPHSFNTLRNEYPAFGLRATVRHYTELLAELIEEGTLRVAPLGRRVTYHDPCYLARYNGVTEAPRRVLRSLGCELVEMPRNRANTYCCGAGGGRIWMDDSGLAERPSENRIREAAALGVELFVVACPKDLAMYSDAVKTTGHEDRLTVVDIVSLVAEAQTRAALSAGVGAPGG